MNNTLTPLVSICCITYNHAAYISECLDGFLMQQTDFPFEILVFDDASTDGTREIIVQYAEHDKRIFTFLQEENQWTKGKYGLIEWLFPGAKGKYVALCEGDDYWTDPLKLQKQVDFLEMHPDCAICHHPVQALKDGELSVKESLKPGKNNVEIYSIEKLTDRNFIFTCSVIFRREVLDTLPGWFSELPVGDYPLFLFAGKMGNYGMLMEAMAVYRAQGGIWSSKDKVQKAKTIVQLLSKLHVGFQDMPEIQARLLRFLLKQAEIVRQSGSTDAEEYVLASLPSMAGVFPAIMDEYVLLREAETRLPTFKQLKKGFLAWFKWKIF